MINIFDEIEQLEFQILAMIDEVEFYDGIDSPAMARLKSRINVKRDQLQDLKKKAEAQHSFIV